VAFSIGTRLGSDTLPFRRGREGEADRAIDTKLAVQGVVTIRQPSLAVAPDWLACVERDVKTPFPLTSAHLAGRVP